MNAPKKINHQNIYANLERKQLDFMNINYNGIYLNEYN